MSVDLVDGAIARVRSSLSVELDQGFVSQGRAVEFLTEDGPAHAFFYAPTNRDSTGPADELPPLLVLSHGGPTSAAANTLDLEIQFWTSRGFAVVDVNYGGSSGFGREYRERLDRKWGIVDVRDCLAAVKHLVDAGRVDPDRVCIRGASAGGYTTLRALTTTSVFAAGASHFGVADLQLLAVYTHKFESRYLDSLIGPWPKERDTTYVRRSPVHYADRISCPVILFQGLEDRVVPPEQAEAMVKALRARRIPHAYVTFPNEGHGFRAAKSIVRALQTELSFYGTVLGFDPPDGGEPVHVIGGR